jgi:hypothetical protein
MPTWTTGHFAIVPWADSDRGVTRLGSTIVMLARIIGRSGAANVPVRGSRRRGERRAVVDRKPPIRL